MHCCDGTLWCTRADAKPPGFVQWFQFTGHMLPSVWTRTPINWIKWLNSLSLVNLFVWKDIYSRVRFSWLTNDSTHCSLSYTPEEEERELSRIFDIGNRTFGCTMTNNDYPANFAFLRKGGLYDKSKHRHLAGNWIILPRYSYLFPVWAALILAENYSSYLSWQADSYLQQWGQPCTGALIVTKVD